MILPRSENLQYKTIRGVLVNTGEKGISHILVDDGRRTYHLEAGRKSDRLDALIGTRVEIKGLIEPRPTTHPTVHVIQYAAADSYSRIL